MPKTVLEELLRKPVIVRANGFVYKGILLEVSPTDITLKRETGYISIPMDRITAVTDPEPKKKEGPAKFVDPSYYTLPEPTQPGVVDPTEPPKKKKED